MAIEFISWALEQDLPTGPKFVLVALCNRSNHDGECWPSQKDISSQTGMAPRSIRNHLTWLIENGYIRKDQRRRKNGSYTSDLFTIQRKKTPVAKSAVGKKRPQPVAKSATPEPSLDNNKLLSEPKGHFDQFWKEYPRKIKRKDSEKTYLKAIRKATHKEIMQGLAKYKSGKPDYADWAHPTSWLNQERWNDEYEEKDVKRNGRNRGYTEQDASRDALAELGYTQSGTDSSDGGAMLCNSGHLRIESCTAENPHESHD